MKNLRTVLSLMAALTLSAVMTQGQVLTLNLNNLPGANIQFNGASSFFQFNNSSLGQWWITSVTGGTGSAVYSMGSFAAGPYTYGTVTVNGFDEWAPVFGPVAALSITDSANVTGTGTINWGQVSTYKDVGGLNANLTFNVSNLSYNGADPDLLSFFNAGSGSVNVSFQFNPGKTLSQLTTGAGPYQTSFSGSLTAIPEPASILLLGLGALLFVRRSSRP